MLNAKHHDREASIVAQAGRKGAVTVATNMAGRGTDIKLGGNPDDLAEAELRQRGLDPEEHVEEWAAALPAALERAEAGGQGRVRGGQGRSAASTSLGTERHESRRIDNQLRGRSGRQGDPGESRFYLSLGDDLMRLFKAQMVERVMSMANVPDDVPIENKMVTRAIASAQSQVEQQNFETRKNVLKYDEVLNRQREVIYGERRRVLEGEDLQEQVAALHGRHRSTRTSTRRPPRASPRTGTWTGCGAPSSSSTRCKVTVEELEEAAGDRAGITAEFIAESVKDDIHEQYDDARGAARLGDHARAGAPGRAVGAGPQVARAPLRDGLPPGGHRPARDGAAGPAGGVPARGLRHVHRDDGRHQGGVRRLPVQPGGPGRAAGRGGPGRGRRAGRQDKQDAVPAQVGFASGDPREGAGRAAAASSCTSPAPTVDGEGGVVEGDFERRRASRCVRTADGLTRAERRKQAKGGRRRKK